MKTLLKFLLIPAFILLTSCGNPEDDFKKAEQANTEQAFNEFIARHPQSPLVMLARNHIEELTYHQAKSTRTLSGYQSYLERYPAGRFSDEARREVQNGEFAQALQSPTVSTLETLLERYPTSTNGPQAKEKLAELLLPGVIEGNNAAAYEGFLKRFAGTAAAKTASLNLAKLEYGIAVAANDIEAYEAFLRKYPDSEFVADVKTRIEPQLEERDWNQAQSNNSAPAFLDYHKKHERLSRVSVLTGNLKATPSMQMTFDIFGGTGGSSSTTVALEMTGQEGLPKELSVAEASRFGLINAEPAGPGVALVDMRARTFPNASVILLKKTGAILAIGLPEGTHAPIGGKESVQKSGRRETRTAESEPQPGSASEPWHPGANHPGFANVVAGDTPGDWLPAPGFAWASEPVNGVREDWSVTEQSAPEPSPSKDITPQDAETTKPDDADTFIVTKIPANDTLTVRAGPGASHKSVASLPKGTTGIRITGEAVLNGRDDWVPISFEGGKGWARPKYLELSKPPGLFIIKGVSKGDTLNIRSGPGSNNSIATKMKNGDGGIRITGLPVANGPDQWVPISFPGGKGWTRRKFLEPENPTAVPGH